MPDQRLFFALWPDRATRNTIVERTAAIVGASEGRAVKPQNLHVTLAFLHNVERRLIPCIEAAAIRAAGSSFDLELSRLGSWSRSRLVWLAPAAGPGADAPARLAQALWRELEPCGFSPEIRRYTPHVTLARKAKVAVKQASIATIHWSARSFALVESLTGRQQSEYAVLKTFPLKPDGQISR